MRQTIRLIALSALIAGLGLMLGSRAKAQIFTNLHSFAPSDGGNPYAGVVLAGHTLYGVASEGGIYGHGALFAVNTNGTEFSVLHQFTLGTYDPSEGENTNSDGIHPCGSLIVSDDVLYGTTELGGSAFTGVIFRMKTDGTGFTNLHNFTTTMNDDSTNIDGARPQAGVILSGDTLYGVTTEGGLNGNGTVFAVQTNGAGFRVLHQFTGVYGSRRTNDDGAYPYGGVCVSGSNVYGTTYYGGKGGNGAVFKVNAHGTSFTNLYSFSRGDWNIYEAITNYDGANPAGALIVSGDTIYGTTVWGGVKGEGAVFALKTNGTGFTVLHTFSARGAYPNTTNSDGAEPWGGLVLSGRTLYGVTSIGGASDGGAVFAVTTDGASFVNLYSISNAAMSWVMPWATLCLSGGTVYGTSYYGGTGGSGTVFSLLFSPALTFNCSGSKIILSWPTNFAGLTLKSTTNLASSSGWSTVLPAPVIVNGQNTVTNTMASGCLFYQLTR
jgi:uncharacterized repeat protein (TIGR03803 family)